MKFAAWMMYLSAALHFAAPLVMPFGEAVPLLAAGVVWAVLGYLTATTGSRALGYLCFVLALIGVSLALGMVPAPLGVAIAAADALAALGLMGALWSKEEVAA